MEPSHCGNDLPSPLLSKWKTASWRGRAKVAFGHDLLAGVWMLSFPG